MLSVTKPALQRLSRRLAHKAAGDDVALRITKLDDGWQLGPDCARSGDVKIAHDGRNVLLLDAAASKATDELTLILRKTDAGLRLRLRRRASGDE